jgi:hypothetical protein
VPRQLAYMSRTQAQLRGEAGQVAREREERVAEVYPFPRYQERRTIQIKGQTVPPPSRRRNASPRRQSPTVHRMAAQPDRVAMYAVLLGLVLIVMALVTTHG